MKPSPIRLGSMLFTLVEPQRGHEVAYNRWYERDHFYSGVMIGAYSFAGRRYVATREDKALRVPGDSPGVPDPMRGSYLAIYWVLAGHHDEWNQWSVEQVNRLHEHGRMFEKRDHIYTIIADHDWAHYRDADPVPAELALDHPYPGLVAVVGGIEDGASREDLDAWYREQYLPDALKGSPVALCLSFTPVPLRGDAPADVPRSEGRRFVHLYFLEGESTAAWDAHFAGHAAALAGTGLGRLLWASPFRPTLPGTDTYTDQLW